MTSLPQLTYIAAEQKSAEVTDWAARVGWLVGLALFVALIYWLMREGWKWRGTLQGDLPELPVAPDGPGEARLTVLSMSGRYHGSTTAGQWLDRIVAHGLGTRSRVELTLTDAGLDVVRPGGRLLRPAGGPARGPARQGHRGQGPHRGRPAGRHLGARRPTDRLGVPLRHGSRAQPVGRDPDPADRHNGKQQVGNGRRTMTTSTRGTTKVPAVLVLEDGRVFRGRAYGAVGVTFGKPSSPPA